MKSELVPVSGDEYKSIMKIMRNWLLIGLGSLLMFIITTLMVNFKVGNRIILGFLMIIQFGLILVAAFYYLIVRKLLKEMGTRARNT